MTQKRRTLYGMRLIFLRQLPGAKAVKRKGRYLTASFRALPALKPGTLEAAILISAPVCGLRPVRAARSFTEKVPKPIRVTWSPFFRAPVMELVIASNARPAAALEISADSAIASISSDLFTLNPFDFRLKMLEVGFFSGLFRLSHKQSENSILLFFYSLRCFTGDRNRHILRGSPWYWLLHGETVIPMGSPTCQQLIPSLMSIYALGNITGIFFCFRRRRLARGIFGRRIRCIFQGNVQHLINPLNRTDLQRLLDIIRYLLEITDIFIRNQNGLDATTVGCQQLFLQPADRQYPAPQCDLSGHGYIGPHRNSGQCRNQRGAHADTGARAVFRGRTFRNVDVQIVLFMEIISDSEPCCTAANHGERSLDRLLHHITQRTGFHHATLTRGQGAFDGQQFAAHLGPGQARHLANLVAFLGQAVLELLHAGIIFQHVRRQGNRSVITALYVLAHHLTADLGNLPLQAAHTGFPGVVADQVAQGLFRQLELVLTQAISLDLLGQQVTQGNVDLLVFGVTRNPDDLHTVQQRRRNIHGVGGTHEHHIGKVVIHFQVMVVEGVVLFRVQDLKQGRRRVTPMVHTHLVDFIKQEQRVFHLYLGQLLQQLARQGADVGFAVTTDFRFVTHATQGHAGVFPVGSLGNGLPQRGLAHTGRPYQAQYRPFDLLHPALHRQVLKDAFLDFIQAVVVPVENLARFFQVVANAAALFPGHCQHPVDVAPHYRGFGRHGRHHLQLVQFRFGLLAGFFRQAGLLELLLQLFKIVVTLTQIAHLFLDGLHLFVQVILPLAALHLLLHAATDAFFNLDQVDLAVQFAQQQVYPLAYIQGFQQFLLLRNAHIQVRGHGVYQALQLIDAGKRIGHFRRHFLGQFYELLKFAHQGLGENVFFALGQRLLIHQNSLAGQEVGFFNAGNAGPGITFNQHFNSAVR